MANRIVDALSGEVVLYSNSLATVTRRSVVLRDAEARSQIILSLSRITQVKKITTTYPFLLVIATASLVIAAAAASSREGGAAIPFAVLGILLLAGYFLSRRGSVLLVAGSEILETVAGTPAEAAALIAAIASAQTIATDGEQIVWPSVESVR